MVIAPLLAAVLGLLVGSFVNVVVHRVPRGESIVLPPSRCPRCGHVLRAWENVPVLSWLALRGRCSACKASISIRYPLVELVTSALFALCVLEYGVSIGGAAACGLSAVLVAILFFDLDHLLIPDGLVIPCALFALVFGVASNGVAHAMESGAIGGAGMGLIYVATRGRGMGLGDVKLAAALGLALVPAAAIALIAASFVVGALLAMPVLLAGSRGRRDALPFGPFLIVAAYLLLFAPQAVFGPFEAYRAWIATRTGI